MPGSHKIAVICDDIRTNIEDISIKAHRDYNATLNSANRDLAQFQSSDEPSIKEFTVGLVEALSNKSLEDRIVALDGLRDQVEELIVSGAKGVDKMAEVLYKHLYAAKILEKIQAFAEESTSVPFDKALEESAYKDLESWVSEIKENNQMMFLLAYAPAELQDALGSTIGEAHDLFDLKEIEHLVEHAGDHGKAIVSAMDLSDLKDRESHIESRVHAKREQENDVLSRAWVYKKAKELVEPSDAGVRPTAYLNYEDGVLGISDAGIKEAERILTECIQNQDMDVNLSQEQLVLFSLYFGVDIVKNMYDRYGLKGEGTETQPFDYDNLRAIIVGIGANYTIADLQKMPEPASESLNKILKSALSDDKLNLPLRMLRDFDKRRQNHIPIRTLPWYKQLGVYIGAIAEVIGGFLIKKSLDNYADAFTGGNGESVTSALFSITSFSNEANENFLADVQFLSSQRLAKNFSNDEDSEFKSSTEVAREVVAKLEETRTLADFYKTYPVFDNSCTEAEKKVIEKYFAIRPPEDDTKAALNLLVNKKVEQVLKAGRAEFMAHNLSYKEQYKRDGHVLKLPRKDGSMLDFEVEGVIKDEKGLGLGFYSPVKGIEVKEDTVPLIINIPGTHDIDSVIRDLHPISAGFEEFSPDHPEKYRERIIKALNQKIAEMKRIHPGKKIEIEIFGHSLGGGDSYNVDLMILEALAQNKYKNDKKLGIEDPLADIDREYAKSENPNIKDNYSRALRTCLGQENRKFGPLYSENRRFEELDITNINLENISLVSRCSDRGAGMSKPVCDARQAATAYLCKDSDFKKEELNLHIKGDLLMHTAAGQGMPDASPDEPLFKDKVDVDYMETDLGMGRYLWRFLEKDEVGPVAAHTVTQALSLEHSIKKDHTVLSNKDKDSFDRMNKSMNGVIKVPFTNTPVSELFAYRALKYTLYKSAKLLNFAFNLIVTPFRALRRLISDTLRPEEYRSDIRHDNISLGEEIISREHARAQEILQVSGLERSTISTRIESPEFKRPSVPPSSPSPDGRRLGG